MYRVQPEWRVELSELRELGIFLKVTLFLPNKFKENKDNTVQEYKEYFY